MWRQNTASTLILERGRSPFTDDIETFKALLQRNKFFDYGTAFAKEWYQIFFHDPVGNIIEVHQMVRDLIRTSQVISRYQINHSVIKSENKTH